MKMPERIDTELFAPCGMNCRVCYRHCFHKKPCAVAGRTTRENRSTAAAAKSKTAYRRKD